MTTVFQGHQYDLSYPDGIENHWWHLTRNRMVLGEVRKVTGPGSAVLDIGCGRGITVRHLRQRGIDCRGVEPGITKAVRGVEDHVRFGQDASDLPGEERSRYDTLLLLDVLEHLVEPATVLAALITRFPRVSTVIITVPARPEIWSNYDEFYGHQRRYTAEMVEDLATMAACEIAYQTYYFRPMYVPARILSALNVRRSTRNRAPKGITKALHRLIAYGMMVDYILPGQVPGMGIVARMNPRAAAAAPFGDHGLSTRALKVPLAGSAQSAPVTQQ